LEIIGLYKILNHYLEKQNGDVTLELLILKLRTSSFNSW